MHVCMFLSLDEEMKLIINSLVSLCIIEMLVVRHLVHSLKTKLAKKNLNNTVTVLLSYVLIIYTCVHS